MNERFKETIVIYVNLSVLAIVVLGVNIFSAHPHAANVIFFT